MWNPVIEKKTLSIDYLLSCRQGNNKFSVIRRECREKQQIKYGIARENEINSLQVSSKWSQNLRKKLNNMQIAAVNLS